MYEVYATDNDEGLNGAVRYSFLKTTGNRDWEYFTIDPISGLIQTAQRLDREKQAVYSVRGKAPEWGRMDFSWSASGWLVPLIFPGPLSQPPTPSFHSDWAPSPLAHLGGQRPGPASAIRDDAAIAGGPGGHR